MPFKSSGSGTRDEETWILYPTVPPTNSALPVESLDCYVPMFTQLKMVRTVPT